MDEYQGQEESTHAEQESARFDFSGQYERNPTSNTDQDNQHTEECNDAHIKDSLDPDTPSETESITSLASSEGTNGMSESEDDPIMETKVQILYGQLRAKEMEIKELKVESYQTRRDFEIFEKESSEYMEDLQCNIEELKEKLNEREQRIEKLESLQVIPEDPDVPVELLGDIEKLKQQLKDRDDEISGLKGAQLNLEQNLSEKCKMLEKVEESESLNFGLIEDRDQEIERLNQKIESLEYRIGDSQENADWQHLKHAESALEAANHEIGELQKRNDSLELAVTEQKAHIESLNNELRRRYQQDREAAETKEMNDSLVQLLKESEEECTRLAGQLQDLKADIEKEKEEEQEMAKEEMTQELDDICQELTEYRLEVEALTSDKTSLIQEKENLKFALSESEVKCSTLNERLAEVTDKVSDATEADKQEIVAIQTLQEVTSQLTQERALNQKLEARIDELAADLASRDQKIADLGHSSDVSLIDSVVNTKKHLKRKEEEIEALKCKLRRPLPDATSSESTNNTGATNDSIPTDIKVRKKKNEKDANVPCEKDAGSTEEDVRSIECLIKKQETLRVALDTKFKMLSNDLRECEFDEQMDTSADQIEVCSRLFSHFKAAIDDFRSFGHTNDGLIKAFQLEVQNVSSLEKSLNARKVQVEMLIQELEEVEKFKDNLGASMNSTGSSCHSIMLSAKLENLLADIQARDEKINILEWLTVDLSKSLDGKTEELEEVKRISREEKKRLEHELELFQNEASVRAMEIKGLKNVIQEDAEALKKLEEARSELRQGTSTKEGLQSIIDSLTTDLKESESTLATVKKDLTEKQAVLETQKAQLVGLEDLKSSLDAERARNQRSEKQIDVLQTALNEKDITLGSLKQKLQESREVQSQSLNIQGELQSKHESLVCAINERDRCIEDLTVELEAKEEVCVDLEHEIDSLVGSLKTKDQSIDDLISEKGQAREEQVRLKRELDEAKSQLTLQTSSLKDENDQLIDQLGEFEEENRKLLTELSSLRDELNAAQLLQSQVDKLQQDKEVLIKQLDSKSEDFSRRLEAENDASSKAKDLVEKQTREISKLNVELAEMQGGKTKLEYQIDALKDCNKQLAGDLHKCQNELERLCLVEEQVAKLVEEKRVLMEEQAAYVERLNNMESNDRSDHAAREELELQVQEASKLSLQLKDAQKAKQQLEAQLSECGRTHDALTCEIEICRDKLKRMEGLEADNEKLRKHNQQISEDLAMQTSALGQQIEQERLALSNAKQQLTNESEEKLELKLKLEQTQKIKAQIMEELSECKDQAKRISNDFQTVEEERALIRDIEVRVENLKEENDVLAKELADKTELLEKSAELQAHIDELRRENKKLASFLEAKGAELEEATVQIEQLTNKNNELCCDIQVEDARERETLKLSSKIEKLAEQNEALLKDLKTRDEKLEEANTLKAQMEELKEMNGVLVSDLKGWENRVKELERHVAAKDEVFQEMTVVQQVLEDQRSRHQDLLKEIDSLTSELEAKDKELEAVKSAHKHDNMQPSERQPDPCGSALATDVVLREEIQNLQKNITFLERQVDELSTEKSKLLSQLDALKQKRLHDEHLLQSQQQQFSQLSENMESVASVLAEREQQLAELENEKKWKDEFTEGLQKTIDLQSTNLESLMEEHESECAELQKKLESMTCELEERNLHLLEIENENTEKGDIDMTIHRLEAEKESLKAENRKVAEQLEAIGFDSMGALVQALSMKCQEHNEMAKTIQSLQSELQQACRDRSNNKSNPAAGQDAKKGSSREESNVPHIHKVRELETKIEIFREEICEKNAIIKNLTSRLSDASLGEGISNPDAPGLRLKRVANTIRTKKHKKNLDQKDQQEAQSEKEALSSIPALMAELQQRKDTIALQKQEISSHKRAVEALVRGLEHNVQEKIVADKQVHESKAKCSQFRTRVKRLSKQLREREKMLEELEMKNHPVKRNLELDEEMKSLSVNELVDLLNKSRVLAEDLEQERERLIENATNMSIALADSRSKVDELMQHLEPYQFPQRKHPEEKLSSKGIRSSRTQGKMRRPRSSSVPPQIRTSSLRHPRHKSPTASISSNHHADPPAFQGIRKKVAAPGKSTTTSRRASCRS